jgi:glycosyltransferase involved in cell wall biosynthesis
MLQEKPGISIIIPVYNREKYLSDAIDSILKQNYPGPLEIIISDDGSIDKSIDIAFSYNDSRIKVLRKPADCKTQGAASARNRGINAASHTYICFLDSDDYQLDGFLETMIQGILSNEKCDFAFCRTMERIESDSQMVIKPWTKKKITELDIKHIGITRHKVVHTNTFIFRKNIFNKVGYFNEKYSNVEDIDMWLRIGENFKCVFIDFVGTVRRKHGYQLTMNDEYMINTYAIEVFKNALRRAREQNDLLRIYRLQYRILMKKIKQFALKAHIIK